MCVPVEVARKKLQALWLSSKQTFKFAATPAKPPKPPPPAKAKRPPPTPELTSTQEFDVILGLAARPQDEAAGSSSGGGGATSGGSGSGSGSDALSQLRDGRPAKKPKAAKTAAPRKQRVVDKPEAATLDLLSPAVDLPVKLGRGDVHQKRVRKLERTTVPILVGENGVSGGLAPKMQRSQQYATPDNRPNILAECVRAYRAAAR